MHATAHPSQQPMRRVSLVAPAPAPEISLAVETPPEAERVLLPGQIRAALVQARQVLRTREAFFWPDGEREGIASALAELVATHKSYEDAVLSMQLHLEQAP